MDYIIIFLKAIAEKSVDILSNKAGKGLSDFLKGNKAIVSSIFTVLISATVYTGYYLVVNNGKNIAQSLLESAYVEESDRLFENPIPILKIEEPEKKIEVNQPSIVKKNEREEEETKMKKEELNFKNEAISNKVTLINEVNADELASLTKTGKEFYFDEMTGITTIVKK